MSWPMRSPADASPPPLRMARRTAWGQCGSLLLHCSGLAPPTPCRSLPALSLEPRVAMPQIIPINDPADQRIAAYTNIRERDLIGRQGVFVAEGEVVLRVLLTRSRHEPLSIFIAERRLAGLMPLLATVRPSVPIYTAPQAIMDGIAGFPMHRGILALGRGAPPQSTDQLLAVASPRAIVLCL